MGQVMAMNAAPLQLMVCAGLSQRFYVEDTDEIFLGIEAAAKRYGADVTAVDIQSSYTGLTLSVTAIGEGDAGLLTRRGGARDTDLICLSGNVGAAYMGLQLLEREKKVFSGECGKDELPELQGYAYILERYLKPELPKALLENLRKDELIPTSMCLVNNGLSHGILSIAKSSGTGAKVYVDKIPLRVNASLLPNPKKKELSPLVAALNGGDDYQMLFTMPLDSYQILCREYNMDIIGHICDASAGCTLVTPTGGHFPGKSRDVILRKKPREEFPPFCCLEIGFGFKIPETGHNGIGKSSDQHVVFLNHLVEGSSFHCDPVFGSFKLCLQLQEILVGL